MNIVVIDGQGGQLGAQLVKEITAQLPLLNITVIVILCVTVCQC